MLRVFTAFSGYDSQCMALDAVSAEMGFDYELVGWSEIDKYAIKAHNAVYPQWADRNFGDITKIAPHTLPDFDLFTYSSPCQDFSNAGRQAGGERGSGTRSSLLWYCEEIIRVKKPRFLLLENVKALVSKKFLPTFMQWEKVLRDMGYTNYTEVLNSKNYGTPQNRERVFCLSILDGGWYEFPPAEHLTLRLKDVLEQEVDEKYYLSDKLVETLSRDNKGFKAMQPSTPHIGIASCLTARMAKMGRGDNYIIDNG